MKRGSQISRWLNQVKADRRLCMSDIKIAIQLTQRTNADGFARSGALVTWQGVARQAKETGLDERTVQRAAKRLRDNNHVAIQLGGGRNRSNRYTLILQTVAPETPAAVPPFSRQNPDTRVPDHKTPAAVSRNPGSPVPKPRQRCHPNLLINNSRTSATTAETEDSGPRQRVDALGPHPLGLLEPDLRRALGEDFEWLSMATLVAHTADVITLAVLNVHQGDNIRRHCERTILETAGARELKFVVGLTADPRRPAAPPAC